MSLMMFEVPSLGPGVATSSTRKDQETGTGAGSEGANPLELRLPPALMVSSQVVQIVEPLFSAAAAPATLSPVMPLLAGKGVVEIVFVPKRPKEVDGAAVTDVVLTSKTMADCTVETPEISASERTR